MRREHIVVEIKYQNHGKLESRPEQRAYTKAIALQVMNKKRKYEGTRADRNEETAN